MLYFRCYISNSLYIEKKDICRIAVNQDNVDWAKEPIDEKNYGLVNL